MIVPDKVKEAIFDHAEECYLRYQGAFDYPPAMKEREIAVDMTKAYWMSAVNLLYNTGLLKEYTDMHSLSNLY